VKKKNKWISVPGGWGSKEYLNSRGLRWREEGRMEKKKKKKVQSRQLYRTAGKKGLGEEKTVIAEKQKCGLADGQFSVWVDGQSKTGRTKKKKGKNEARSEKEETRLQGKEKLCGEHPRR